MRPLRCALAALAGASAILARPPQDAPAAARAALREILPAAAWITADAAGARWRDAEGRDVLITGADSAGDLLVVAGSCAITVPRGLLEQPPGTAISRLHALARRAEAGDVPRSGLRLIASELLGVHLAGEDLLVLEGGVARRVPLEVGTGDEAARDRRQTVAEAAGALAAALPASGWPEIAVAALRDVLATLDGHDEDSRGADAVRPGFVRHLVRHGWLAGLLPEDAGAARLADAVADALRLRPTALFEGDGLAVATVADAFGRAVACLRAPDRTAYALELPGPEYLPLSAPLVLVVDLPAGADPLAACWPPRGAAVYARGRALASWTPDGGLAPDLEAWTDATSTRIAEVEPDLLPGRLPPHLLVLAQDGDVLALVTGKGVLRPPQGGDPRDGQRFLSDAAALLTDAAHLDLVGEHLVAYVPDSPDPRRPRLLGSPQLRGDIHQTANETLATAAGGLLRGDCDDLAELYQEILRRQGRLAHVAMLPAHAGIAWCERDEGDGAWRAFLLHSGPPVAFAAAECGAAVLRLYRAFAGEDLVDPTQLAVALRFSGENTRSTWYLGHRVFSEPRYAEVMIDVQRDWHFHTYQRGIAKMKALIASGDGDPANHRELAGLYRSAGQYALAAEAAEAALARAEGAAARLSLHLDLVDDHARAGRRERARELARRFLDADFPAAAAELGDAAASMILRAAQAFSRRPELVDLGREALRAALPVTEIEARLAETIRYLGSRHFDRDDWVGSERWVQRRRQLRSALAAAATALDRAGPATASTDPALLLSARLFTEWVDKVALVDVEEPGEVFDRYDDVAALYSGIIGPDLFARLVDRAALPEGPPPEPGERAPQPVAMLQDLPWIRASVPYWLGEALDRFDLRHETLDRDAVAHAAARAEEALAAAGRLGLRRKVFEEDVMVARLAAAFAEGDSGRVRALLAGVAGAADKALRDRAIAMIGLAARFVPAPRFAEVLAAFEATLDFKPGWFGIAWTAAAAGAFDQAQLAAARAVARHPGDAAFQEEARFLAEVAGRR